MASDGDEGSITDEIASSFGSDYTDEDDFRNRQDDMASEDEIMASEDEIMELEMDVDSLASSSSSSSSSSVDPLDGIDRSSPVIVLPEGVISPEREELHYYNLRRTRRYSPLRAGQSLNNEDDSDTDFENDEEVVVAGTVENEEHQHEEGDNVPVENVPLHPVVEIEPVVIELDDNATDNAPAIPHIQRNEVVETVQILSDSSDQERRTPKSTTKGKKRLSKDKIESPAGANDDGDDGMTCSVCLDTFTNSGPHRLVSLRCGHLFGHSCVERWLKTGCSIGARRCPNCNKKAKLSDIRIIYARKLLAIDTTEKEQIQEQLEKIKLEKSQLELELAKCKLNCDLQDRRIKDLHKRIKDLESREADRGVEILTLGSFDSQNTYKSFPLIHDVEINKNGGCRVLAYSPRIGLLVVSQSATNPIFPGYGVRKLDGVDFRPTQFIHLHSKPIRDMAFHPNDSNLMLSVSLDKTAKLVDNVSNNVVQVYSGDNVLWSCCWDTSNPHQLLTGSQNGLVTMYDRRHNTDPVTVWSTSGDTTPVVSLAYVPPTRNSVLEQGGFFSCRLNTVYVYTNNSVNGQLILNDGPFVSLNYNPSSQLMLASTRPSSRFPAVRHIVSQLSASQDQQRICNHLHTFNCGSSARVMSRSCQILMPDSDTCVAAYNETLNGIQLLSINKGSPVCTTRVQDTVVDMCSLQCTDSSIFLASLTDKNVFVHKVV